MSRTPSREEATPLLKPMQMHGSRGIKKPKKPDPFNIAEPLVHPQESVTTTKNRSQAMKTSWSNRKSVSQQAEDAGGPNEVCTKPGASISNSRHPGLNMKLAKTNISSTSLSGPVLRAYFQVPQDMDNEFVDMFTVDHAPLIKGRKRKADVSLCSHIRANSGMNPILIIPHLFLIVISRTQSTSSLQTSESHVRNLYISKGTIGTYIHRSVGK